MENLEIYGRPIIRPQSPLTPPDYTPPEGSPIKDHHQQDIYYYSSENNNNFQQPDSLDSNYHNKSSVNSLFRLSYEELPSGLSLPNYYPDSKYDTDNTDNVSLIDNISSVSLDNNNNQTKTTKYSSSCDNISGLRFELNEQQNDSISYDENIVLSANKALYDNEKLNTKPKTIRNPTPFTENYFYCKNQPIYTTIPTNSDDDDTETDCNIDVITEKIIHSAETDHSKDNTLSNYSNIENNPLYENKLESEFDGNQPPIEHCSNKERIKTLIEVEADTEQNIKDNSEQYKTIVTVESGTIDVNKDKINNNTQEDSIKRKTSRTKDVKQHSHNYLKEFLESQKGSKKPLQNFIVKKFTNLSRRNSKEIDCNLEENQFYSLPDITLSRNLQKCEKIDRKLRKCDRNLSKTRSDSNNENRFIVNIGKHFDITANSTIPLDFEVKISKVPKKNKQKVADNNQVKSEEQLLDAVKCLKQTLNEENRFDKPEIVGVKTKSQSLVELPIHIEQIYEMNGNNSDSKKEYQEKLGTMRNYWNKLVPRAETEETEEAPSCKIVDVQTKVEDVKKKFERYDSPEPEKPPNKVQLAKQLFEPKIPEKCEKLSPFVKETCSYFENSYYEKDNQYESLNPNIVEIIEQDKKPKETKCLHKPVSKSRSITYPEFDHVRYRVVKSDLFQKKIFANCEKESQFDGLMQYLQDYSFQELLIDNNIVIIEPIRTKVQYEKPTSSIKTPKNVTPLLHKSPIDENEEESQSKLRRHFFYHPIRVNKEVNDDELPNPDTVRQVRQFFEGGLKRSQSNQELNGITKEQLQCAKGQDPDKDRCSTTDTNSHPSNMSDFDSQENLYDSITNNSELCCEQQYVSEDILEKIRECGSTVTYYGGRVVQQQIGQPVLTKAIMEEIKNNEQRYTDCQCSKNDENRSNYNGVKFRLVKSNSCSSRLELVGTETINLYRKNDGNNCILEMTNENGHKNTINESIRDTHQPKIIAEEKKNIENKMTQWGDVNNKSKIYASITFNEKNSQNKINYDYHNYDKLKTKKKTIDDMEFEPYEVAS